MASFSFIRCCPQCGSRDICRSRREGIIEKYILPLLRLRPFHCEDCARRYYGWIFAKRAKPEETNEELQEEPANFEGSHS